MHMELKGRKGLALSELLILVAIIALLAAMLFPVFARARQAAREEQCLSNVKNIAVAIQMYLADNNDTFPPSEHCQEALGYFAARQDAEHVLRCGINEERIGWMATRANPYLRWPVVLDKYLQNRALWQCPEAKMVRTARFIVPGPDWLGHLRARESEWGDEKHLGPCLGGAFPPGWGGEVTDSLAQQLPAGRARAGAQMLVLARGLAQSHGFYQSIGANEDSFRDVKLTQLKDPTKVPIVGDTGPKPDFLTVGTLAYPDICCPECAGVAPFAWKWPSQDCPKGTYCPECPPLHAPYRFLREGPDRWRQESARHSGGSNVGFADGHAKCLSADQLIAMSDQGELESIGWMCLATSEEGYRQTCGEPPAGMVFLHQKHVPSPSYRGEEMEGPSPTGRGGRGQGVVSSEEFR